MVGEGFRKKVTLEQRPEGSTSPRAAVYEAQQGRKPRATGEVREVMGMPTLQGPCELWEGFSLQGPCELWEAFSLYGPCELWEGLWLLEKKGPTDVISDSVLDSLEGRF